MRTRYRIMFNGVLYNIQYQKFDRTIFGHWRRKWVDYVEYILGDPYPHYRNLDNAIDKVKTLKSEELDKKIRRKIYRKEALSLKNNPWKKIWP